MNAYVLDAGPIVALLDAGEQHHEWSVATVDALDGRVITCEAVLSEAWFLARRGGGDPARVLELLRLAQVQIVPGWSELSGEILKRYAERASVTDACLVALAESERAVVVTLDRTDFTIYRTSTGRSLRALMPPM